MPMAGSIPAPLTSVILLTFVLLMEGVWVTKNPVMAKLVNNSICMKMKGIAESDGRPRKTCLAKPILM